MPGHQVRFATLSFIRSVPSNGLLKLNGTLRRREQVRQAPRMKFLQKAAWLSRRSAFPCLGNHQTPTALHEIAQLAEARPNCNCILLAGVVGVSSPDTQCAIAHPKRLLRRRGVACRLACARGRDGGERKRPPRRAQSERHGPEAKRCLGKRFHGDYSKG